MTKPGLGPYRSKHYDALCISCGQVIRPLDAQKHATSQASLSPDDLERVKTFLGDAMVARDIPIQVREPNAWAEAQRNLTPADMRAAEARRQNVIVEPPYPPTKIRE